MKEGFSDSRLAHDMTFWLFSSQVSNLVFCKDKTDGASRPSVAAPPSVEPPPVRRYSHDKMSFIVLIFNITLMQVLWQKKG